MTSKENFIKQNSFGFKPEMGHLTPTVAFTSYWRFIHERHQIFLRRLAAQPAPWTQDRILAEYKFTNVFRVLDTESQSCAKIANSPLSAISTEGALFRILLFKIYNLTSTWNLLCNELGEEPQLSNWNPDRYGHILCAEQARGKKIFSSAYMMFAERSLKGPGSKIRMWLETLDRMMRADLSARMVKGGSLEEAVRLLSGYRGIDDFTGQQYATDFSHTPWFRPEDADAFILPGPGSIDGIAKCFNHRYPVRECSDIIRLMRDRAHELSMQVTGCLPPTLPGIDRPMDLIDFQSGFCECDKYSRDAHPQLNHLAKQGRTKIKTAYRVPAGTLKPLPPPVYPLHWYPAIFSGRCPGLGGGVTLLGCSEILAPRGPGRSAVFPQEEKPPYNLPKLQERWFQIMDDERWYVFEPIWNHPMRWLLGLIVGKHQSYPLKSVALRHPLI